MQVQVSGLALKLTEQLSCALRRYERHIIQLVRRGDIKLREDCKGSGQYARVRAVVRLAVAGYSERFQRRDSWIGGVVRTPQRAVLPW